jgi:hypothetical protein
MMTAMQINPTTDLSTMTDAELDSALDSIPTYKEIPDSSPVASPRPIAPPTVRHMDVYPDLSAVTTTKIPHQNMILDGVCTHCAHCGMPLTDSVSVQRGIGPICSKKGYAEDPTDADEHQAMIDLAEFPELMKFLIEHYKPLGVQGLVNGLVRVASLNRPRGRGQSAGNRELFIAICDSMQSLGHKKMAEVLRNTLVVVKITDCGDESAKCKGNPGCVEVHVKFRDLPFDWNRSIRGRIWGARFDKLNKAWIIPIHHPSDSSKKAMSLTAANGNTLTNKQALWALLVEKFARMSAKTKNGVVKIEAK